MSEERYYENGRYRGMKDSDGRYYNASGELVAMKMDDGSILDYKTGNLWRKDKTQ
jgi:hypothetical protein